MICAALLTVQIISAILNTTLGSSLAYSECPTGDEDRFLDPTTGCLQRDIKAVMLYFPPYVMVEESNDEFGIAWDYIYNSLTKCCNSTVKLVRNHDADVTDVFSLPPNRLMEADIIFPVTAKLETELTFSGKEFAFYDIVRSPGFVLIGHVDYYNEKARKLVIDALLDSWPIFAMIFLLTGIAGIFIWALESPGRNDDFPVSFTRGSFEGFWWAFISMTTVGYGDKTPKSIFGRLFGVLWILFGLIVITVFTATVTSALTNSSSVGFTNALEGQHVAVFQESDAEDEALYIGAETHSYETFEEMHKALIDHKVEGIFIERFRGSYYMMETEDDKLRVFDNVYVKISYKMALNKNTTCKFLEKNNCFKRRVEYPLIESDVKQYTAPLKVYKPAKDAEGVLSGRSPATGIVLLAILGTFLSLGAAGVLFELVKKKSRRLRCKPTSHQSGEKRNDNSLLLEMTTRQLQGLEQCLEKLATEIQNIRENPSSKTVKNPPPPAIEVSSII